MLKEELNFFMYSWTLLKLGSLCLQYQTHIGNSLEWQLLESCHLHIYLGTTSLFRTSLFTVVEDSLLIHRNTLLSAGAERVSAVPRRRAGGGRARTLAARRRQVSSTPRCSHHVHVMHSTGTPE